MDPSRSDAEASPARAPTAGTGEKTTTIATRACDACRARRRKCVFGEESFLGSSPSDHNQVPQCAGCIKLGLVCSFDIPTRTRGPKKRRRLSSTVHSDPPSITASRRPYDDGLLQQDIFNTASPSISHRSPLPSEPGFHYPTDELCPRPLFNVIINDYLQRIYPLVPVVHRPTFKAELASDRDVTDTEYLCLVLSLVALTVGLLPSRFDQYRSMAPELMDRFPTRSTMINYCAQMCTRLRPAGYWDHVNHRKWAVCYCLSIGVFQTGQTNHSRMLEVEAAQFARLLGTHRISEYEGLNCIEKQLRKKAFWLQFYGFAHSLIHVGRREQLVFLDHYTLRDVNFAALTPLDVEDEMITDTTVFHPTSLDHTTPLTNESHVFDAPKSAFTCVSAFIATSQVFFKAVQEALFHVSCDCGTNRTPELRLSRLRDLFRDLQYMLDDLPVSMRQWVFAEDACQARDDFGAATDTAEIAHAQREITRANLHFTHLWLQNFLLEKMDMILQQQASEADGTPETARASEALRTNWTAREDICRQTLHLLHSIPHVYLEPNGLYLAYKVRDVAVALLNCPFEAHEGPSRRAAEYMRDFTSILSRLDRSEIMNTASLKSWVDKDRETSR